MMWVKQHIICQRPQTSSIVATNEMNPGTISMGVKQYLDATIEDNNRLSLIPAFDPLHCCTAAAYRGNKIFKIKLWRNLHFTLAGVSKLCSQRAQRVKSIQSIRTNGFVKTADTYRFLMHRPIKNRREESSGHFQTNLAVSYGMSYQNTRTGDF